MSDGRTGRASLLLGAVCALSCTRAATPAATKPARSQSASSAKHRPTGATVTQESGAPSVQPRNGRAELPRLVPEFVPFGRVVRMDEHRALVAPRATHAEPPSALPQHYESWRERRRTTVGYGYLSVVDVSVDDRFLLVVSEEEAKVRMYDFSSLRPIAKLSVDGYTKFGPGDFVMWPFVPAAANSLLGPGQPSVVFAGPPGLLLVHTGTAQATTLSPTSADTLRFTDDHRVLGATSSVIPEQRSRIAFYGAESDGKLEPLLVLDFAECVSEWDLDAEKRRLAVAYYPSNQIEVLDLAERKVLWAAAIPEYSNSVDISRDDGRVAVGGASVVVFDLNDGRPIAADDHFGNNIHRVRFSPSGDALAVSSYEGKIRIFDAAKPGPGLPLRKVLRHTGTANVYAIAFNRDGSELVSGSGDQTIRVWGP